MPKAKIALGLTRVPALLSALLVLTACASTSPPPTDPRLSGHWRLDPAASDNVSQRVAQYVAKAQAAYRRHLRSVYGDAAGSGEGGGSGGGRGGGDSGVGTEDLAMPLPPDFGGRRALIQQTLSAPTDLTIETSGNDVRLALEGLPGHEYHVGETLSHFDEYGAATITARWRGTTFEIRASYTSGALLDERYQTDPATSALTCTRTLRDPQFGRIELHSLYRRQ
jgi:hypothetical protein